MSTRIMILAGACLGIAIVAAVPDARAQTLYFGGEAGWSILQDQSDRLSTTPRPSVRARYNDGYAVGARAGYEMGPWRFEEEYLYHNNGLDRLNVNGANSVGAKGSRDSHAAMSNVLYDLPVNLGIPVSAHIGAGIGAVDVIDRLNVRGIGRVVNDNDWQLGYQAIGGVRYNLTPNMALDLDYRYLATTDATFKVASAPATRLKTGYSTHNLMASLVYRFGPPPPPPLAAPALPPAPVAAPSRRVFLVFFDWDRDTITPEGMRIVQQAADAYKSGAPVQIQVTGYTDRSGSPGYNQRLSERRATNVANALVRLGVPRNDMAVSGRGENDNRVPTAAGVREPQNRRVEIVFP